MACRADFLRWAGGSLLTLLLCSGCFTIPFIKKRGEEEKKETEPVKKDFDRANVFVGYDKKGNPIVELRLVGQEVTKNGLILHTRLFPTVNFKVRNIFRGLRSINYYPIERRFHRLELRYGRKKLKLKVEKNLEVRDMKPLDANFAHTGVHGALPDTILEVKLKFQDVDRWARLPADTLDAWYAAKSELIRGIQQVERRKDLMDTYRRRQKRDDTRSYTQFDSLYVTTNNTYVYLEKDVNSEILYTFNVGDSIDYGVSDQVWMEIPLPDSLYQPLGEFLNQRHAKALKLLEEQRRAERTRRGPKSQAPEAEIDTTRRMTAYILDVMVQKDYKSALNWENDNMAEPVDAPLFAKVLQDREARRLTRLDSLEKARVDSVGRVKAVADSVVRAGQRPDSIRADSSAGAKVARAGKTPADSLKPTAAAQAQAAASKGVAPGGTKIAAAAGDSARPDSTPKAGPAADEKPAEASVTADSTQAAETRTPPPGTVKKGPRPPAGAPGGDKP